jgi:hypothetical protein
MKIVSRLVREIASEPGKSRETLFPVGTSTRFAFSDSFERGVLGSSRSPGPTLINCLDQGDQILKKHS